MNSSQPLFGLANDYTPDSAGWVRISTYGEHPKRRTVTNPSGQVILENWVQVLTPTIAGQLASGFNSALGRIKRAVRAVPVYVGHPDLGAVAPETGEAIGNMTPVGSVHELQAREDGLYARIGLFQEGQAAVENEGLKRLSPLWWVQREPGPSAGPIRGIPRTLVSIALTNSPNLAGGQALDNKRTPEGVTHQTGTGSMSASSVETFSDPNMKHLLIGLLAAQGVVLANDASDDSVFKHVNERLSKLGADLAALGNEKAALTGRVTTLEGEVTAEKAARQTADTDLAAVRTALANERSKRAEALVDLAIAQGKIPIADRVARITKLTGSAAFDTDAAALANEKVQFRTGSSSVGDRRADANNSGPAQAGAQVIALANELLNKGTAATWDDAWNQTKRTHPALHEQMAAKPGA